MKLPRLPQRDNMIERRREPWRPPVFHVNLTRWESWQALARRFLDLQAASIWQDLRILLSDCQGLVLDVGCGAQPYRPLLPSSARYLGIDTSNAESNFGYQVPDAIYFQGARWPVESESIDVVIATETLEHVERPNEFLDEARRVLKPEGWIVLTVPFAARWHYIPHDYWRFTPSGLRTVFNDAGFSEIVVYSRGNEVTVACYKVMALILMLLIGEQSSGLVRLLCRIGGIVLVPLLACLALIGQISLRTRGGNDCLGYTVVAAAPRGIKGSVP